jgi:hypothetical protein
MDGVWLERLRWRRRGAWLWPSFATLTAVDAVIGHELPPVGDSQTLVAALLLGCALNLGAVLLLSRPLGALVRRSRADLPTIIARDYGGTLGVALVTAALLGVGIAHHQSVLADQQAQGEAVARAEAWIGDRAPAQFRRSLRSISMFAIQPGRIYRACVRSSYSARTYCVMVDNRLPFASSVRPAGYEPNSGLAAGAG